MPIGINDPTSDASLAAQQGVAAAENYDSDADEAAKKAKDAEYDEVKAVQKAYTDARAFDKFARSQFAIDRRYAAGTADLNWAVSTNLIGSMIDILVSFLYARNPDVSVRKTPKIFPSGTKDDDLFAETMEYVISSLWKSSILKKQARKQVRSALSVGVGVLKVLFVSDDPLSMGAMTNQLNDLRDNIASQNALRNQLLTDKDFKSAEEKNVILAYLREQEQALSQRTEAFIRRYLAIDFVSAQDYQCSIDVSHVSDHLDAEWNANAIYRTKDQVKKMFPELTDDDLRTAIAYYQRKPDQRLAAQQPLTDALNIGAYMGTTHDFAGDAEVFTSADSPNTTPGENGPCFYKIIEVWDRTTNHVKTFIDGVKCWAKKPYQPPYPSRRFYPYFLIEFFEVDGERHGQSLSWRLRKLQDEYCRSRSNFRLARERSIPGTLFNAAQLGPTEAQKLEKSQIQEFIGLKPTDVNTSLGELFAEKPTGSFDPRIYDNGPILHDMEKISGVQEALQSSQSVDKTARQAEIEHQGFASRTTADRDVLEDMLSDLAQYTGEVALSGLPLTEAQRIAGPGAFWPVGMDIDDLLTMVSIEVKAGSTGKPRETADRDAWGVIMPQLVDSIFKVKELVAMGDFETAEALANVIRRTMKVMGDDTDPDQYLPAIPKMDPLTGLPMGPDGLPMQPGVPGLPGQVPPVGADSTVPPAAGLPGEAAPPGSLPTPELSVPQITNPV